MILPFQTLRYTTQMAPGQAVSTLRENVGTSKWFSRPPQRYVGRVEEDGTFDIRRNIGGRNSFLPSLHGNVKGAPSGSDISIQFRIHPAVIVFCLAWEAGVLSMPWPAAIGFSGFMVILCVVGFFPEAAQAELEHPRSDLTARIRLVV